MKLRCINFFSALTTLTLLIGPFVIQNSWARDYSNLVLNNEDLIRAPKYIASPPYSLMVKELKRITVQTASESPDPIEPLRQDLEALLIESTTDNESKLYEKLLEYYRIFEPEKAISPVVDPYQEYLKELNKRMKLKLHETP